jgi:hypothetical protein
MVGDVEEKTLGQELRVLVAVCVGMDALSGQADGDCDD